MAGPDFTAQNGLNQVVRYSITNGIATEAALSADALRCCTALPSAFAEALAVLTLVTCPRVRGRRTARGRWRHSKL